MTLATGSRIGPYEIQSPLGEGGMGVVFRARDTKLGRDEPVDKRADIWSFGVVLWEMLTGKGLYQGKTTSDVLAAVIRDEPDLSKTPAKVRPLQRVVAGGGMPTLATTLDARNDYSHSFPWFLPDGRHFLFEDQTQAGINDVMLRVGALDSQEVKTLGPANSNGVYSSGYLLYLRENTLMAQLFDEKRLAVAGEAQPPADQVRSALTPNAVAVFSVSREGLLAYQAGEAGGQQLTWFDRNGKPVGTLGEAADFFSLAFSPDRSSVAATRLGQNNDTWIYDVARGLATRFTFSRTVERDAAWSPDGRSIVYRSNATGPFDLYRKAADGTGSEELLYADGVPKIATSWSPDGRLLLLVLST